MKRQIYYIYAGYYELIITEQKIGRPYVYQAFAYSLEGAMARCEKIDSDAGIVYSHNLKDEVLAHFSWIDEEDLNVPFLDTEKYTLDKLTQKDIMVAQYDYGQYDGRSFECDADGNQIMIDYDIVDFDTVRLSQEDYEKTEDILDSIHFSFPRFEVYIGYDVSGYDYWTRIMEETMRPYIAIRSRKDGYIPSPELVHRYVDKCLDRLNERLDKAGIDPWYHAAA